MKFDGLTFEEVLDTVRQINAVQYTVTDIDMLDDEELYLDVRMSTGISESDKDTCGIFIGDFCLWDGDRNKRSRKESLLDCLSCRLKEFVLAASQLYKGCSYLREQEGIHEATDRYVDIIGEETNHLLHKLWTKAVGTDGYDKNEWRELEKQIYENCKKGEQNDGE